MIIPNLRYNNNFEIGYFMTINNAVNAMAGFFVMLSLLLGVEGSPIFQSSYWLWFTAFVGLNLFQSSFTGFCPAAMIFKAMGLKEK